MSNYTTMLRDNIYTGGNIPKDCILVRVNSNIEKAHYGYAVKGELILLNTNFVHATKYGNIYTFAGADGRVLKHRHDVPKIMGSQFTEALPPNLLPDDLFTL